MTVIAERRKISRNKLWVLFALGLGLLAGLACAGKGVKSEPTADELFARGMKAFQGRKVWGFINTRDYTQASTLFQEFLDKYPYSRFAPEAQLRLADSFFALEEYDSAVLVYDEFQKLRPSHPDIPYVLYQLGQCFFRQVLSIDRDQAAVISAQKWFEELVRRYPESKWMAEAQEKIRKCRADLARREIYVGEFYYRRGDYFSALDRFRNVLALYPDSGLGDQALYYSYRCYQAVPDPAKARETLESLRGAYPGSKFLQKLKD